MRKLYMFFILFLSVVGNVWAKEIKIRGQVVDSLSQTPLLFTTVQILDEDNHPIFVGMVVNDDATFLFDKIKIEKQHYKVVVSHLSGQKTFLIEGDRIGNLLDFGKIQIFSSGEKLDAITVTGGKRTLHSVDRTTYAIDSARLVGVSVTTDLLRKIPEIAVDEIKRTARIMGKENTLVLLNGVNTGTSVDLRAIDFRDVERVEVITSPSSGTEVEYDGMINLILKPKIRNGVSVDLEETVKLDGRSNDGYLGVTLGRDKLRVKLTYDNYYRANPYDLNQLRTDDMTGNSYGTLGYCANPFELSNAIGLNMDLQLTPFDFFNITTNSAFHETNKDIRTLPYREINGVVQDEMPFNKRFGNDYFIGNYTLFYRHTMRNKKSDYLSVNANFGYMSAEEDIDTRYDDLSRIYTRESGDKFSTTLRLEYNNLLSQYFKLNVGAQGYYQHFNSTLNSGPDNENNLRNYRGNIYTDLTAYVKKFQFRIGLKGEANVNDFINQRYGTTSQYAFQPNLSALMKINEKNILKLEYRRPSYYPSAWMLVPYEIKQDEKTVFRGNPNLRLTQYNMLELTYTYRDDAITLNVAPYYQNSHNLIISKIDYDSELNSINTYVNGGKLDRTGIKLNGTLNFLGGAISIDPEINLFYDKMTVDYTRRNQFTYKLGGMVMLALPLGFACGAYGSYRNKMLTALGYREPLYAVDAVFVMKSFEKIGLNIFAGYQTLTESADIDYVYNGQYAQRNYFKFNSKGFMLRLNYYFMTGKAARMERVNTYFDSDRK